MSDPSPERGALAPGAPTPFGRHSVVRTVVAKPVTALLVQRALVMEVAHPAVAAGVEHHSRFRARPLSRAWVTADAAVRLVFGGDDVARGAARQIYRVHDRIHGDIPGDTDHGPPGAVPAGYSAHDAALLTWVWATLVDTAETAFTRWVRPFGPLEAEAFYDEMRSFARFLGIPDPMLPAGRGEFGRYLEDVIGGGALGSSEVSRRVARQVLWYRHWSVPAPVVRLERVLALATVDPRLLDALDLRPSASDAALGSRIDAALIRHYRRVPHLPAVLPALYLALRRPSIGLSGRLGGIG